MVYANSGRRQRSTAANVCGMGDTVAGNTKSGIGAMEVWEVSKSVYLFVDMALGAGVNTNGYFCGLSTSIFLSISNFL